MSRIVVEGVEASFAGRPVLAGASFTVAAGEIVGLCGAAGSGKSTLLALIAGAVRPTRGRIATGEGRVPVAGLALQHPWFALDRPVIASLAAPLHARDLDVFQRLPVIGRRLPGSRAARVQIDLELRQAARALDVQPLLGRPPLALSGSERRRLAVAGAMAAAEDVLLIDEPFADLDADQRRRMGLVLSAFARANGVAVVLAMHDPAPALDLLDAVAPLSEGRIAAVTTPAEWCAWGASGRPRLSSRDRAPHLRPDPYAKPASPEGSRA